jgi:hypothetical protein
MGRRMVLRARFFSYHRPQQIDVIMKTILCPLLCFLLACTASTFRASAQLLQESVFEGVTGVADPDLELDFAATVRVNSSESALIYGISSRLSFDQGFGRILVGGQNRYALDFGQIVDSTTHVHTNASGFTWILLLQAYDWEVRFPGNHLFIHPGIDLFPGQTNVLIGFSRQHPLYAGTQYGWVRMGREVADLKNAFREDGTVKQITFMPTAFAVNPIPDQAIRAGEPPDLPQLVTDVLAPEEGLPTRVRVSWPPGWANMRLESAVELGIPVQWSPVFGMNGTEAVFELPEDGQLYLRLAYVP